MTSRARHRASHHAWDGPGDRTARAMTDPAGSVTAARVVAGEWQELCDEGCRRWGCVTGPFRPVPSAGVVQLRQGIGSTGPGRSRSHCSRAGGSTTLPRRERGLETLPPGSVMTRCLGANEPASRKAANMAPKPWRISGSRAGRAHPVPVNSWMNPWICSTDVTGPLYLPSMAPSGPMKKVSGIPPTPYSIVVRPVESTAFG